MNPLQSARMAGTELANFFTNPKTIKAMGKRVINEALLGAAAQQVAPRLMGQTPSRNVPQSLLNAGVHAAIAAPIAGGMQTLGAPEWAADMTSQMLAGPAAHAITNSITPETTQQPYNTGHELLQMQQMHADLEQQRYNNEINLSIAKNYRAPTQIIHRNPSADIQTMYNMLNTNVRY